MRKGRTRWRKLSDGRVVNVPEDDVPCLVTVHYVDPLLRPKDFPFVKQGDVAYVDIDGETFVRSPRRDFDDIEWD